MADETEPRRFKLPSELDPDEKAATRRPGGPQQVERDEYMIWRREQLRDEQDDLELRGRLLTEQAEWLRARAGRRTTRALEKLTPADWAARREAEHEGRDVHALGDEKATALEQQADELEREAEEIAAHAPTGEPITAAEIAGRMERSNR